MQYSTIKRNTLRVNTIQYRIYNTISHLQYIIVFTMQYRIYNAISHLRYNIAFTTSPCNLLQPNRQRPLGLHLIVPQKKVIPEAPATSITSQFIPRKNIKGEITEEIGFQYIAAVSFRASMKSLFPRFRFYDHRIPFNPR